MFKFLFFLALLVLVRPIYAQQSLLFSGAKDPITDISRQVLLEAYQRMGIEIQTQQFPSVRSLVTANSGKTDGELGRIKGIEADYPNLLRVPVVINRVEGVVFLREIIKI